MAGRKNARKRKQFRNHPLVRNVGGLLAQLRKQRGQRENETKNTKTPQQKKRNKKPKLALTGRLDDR